MRGRGAVRRMAAWIRGRLSGRTPILLYHRVVDVPSDPFGLAISPGHFAEQLEVLARHARPIPLRRLVSRSGGRIPRRCVVITFDDGYADNLLAAKPLLERHDAPATVFVASDCVDTAGEFWWDELEGLLLRPGNLPASFTLDHEGGTFRGELDGAATYTEGDLDRHRRWTFEDDDATTPRHRLYSRLYRLLQAMPPGPQRRAIRDIRAWAGVAPLARAEHRRLSAVELVRLADGGLIEVGAHTRHHLLLPELPPSSQWDEIRGSKGRLEEILGRRVEDFSYPYGGYAAGTVAAVRDAGFASACTTRGAPARRSDPPLELPRLWVGDWDGETMARNLHAWFGG
jgi:peptidoglycan/xylan/chitin deacetylase (PgdA/CDA1 family)